MQSRYLSFALGYVKYAPKGTIVIWVMGMFLIAIFWWAVLDQIAGTQAFIALNTLGFLVTFYMAIRYSLGTIPTVRLLILAGPGLLGGWAYWLSGGTLRVSQFAIPLQNAEMIWECATASVIAGFMSTVGYIASLHLPDKSDKLTLFRQANAHIRNVLGWFSLLFSVFCFWQLSQGSEILWIAGAYGIESSSGGALFGLGIYNSVGCYFLFVSLIALYYHRDSLKRPSMLWQMIALGCIFNLVIRGDRNDSLVVLATGLFFYWTLRDPRRRRIVFYSTFIVLLAWFTAILTHQLRIRFNMENFLHLLEHPFDFVVREYGQIQVLNLDTASSIIGTFYAVYYKTLGGQENLLLGRSYLDFIPRTLPAFLYPNRPMDLAYQMQHEGYWFARGGVLETAEAYWNFGRMGIVTVPFFISWLTGKLVIKTHSHPSPLFKAIPLTILAMMPRWTWYQTFALYKGLVSIFVFAYGFSLIEKAVFKNYQVLSLGSVGEGKDRIHTSSASFQRPVSSK